MESKQQTINDLLSPHCRETFKVADYQREYEWETDSHVKDFWKDVHDFGWKGQKDHFCGVFLFKPTDKPNEWEIVDGQQRLVTFLLLLLAMRELFLDHDYSPADHTVRWIRELRAPPSIELQNSFRRDHEVLLAILNRDLQRVPKSVLERSLLLRSFQFLKTELDREYQGTPDIVTVFANSFLSRVTLLTIWLSPRDNAIRAFETLNSRGRRVEEPVLVKNLIQYAGEAESDPLLGQSLQTWKTLTQQFEEDNLHSLLDLLPKRKAIGLSTESTYMKLAEDIHRAKCEKELELWLAEVTQVASIYSKVLSPTLQEPTLLPFTSLGCEPIHPLIVRIIEIEGYSSPLLPQLEAITVRLIYNQDRPKSRLTQLCENSCEVLRDLGSPISRDARMCLHRVWKDFWVPDSDFRHQFLEKHIYGPGIKMQRTRFILQRLEAYHNPANPMMVIVNRNCSIEHIAPQTPTDDWRSMLGKANFEQLHRSWVHTIGNLTVLMMTDNSVLRNQSFEVKRAFYLNAGKAAERYTVLSAFKDVSHSNLNNYFRDVNAWTFDAIQRRGRQLSDLACKIWQFSPLT